MFAVSAADVAIVVGRSIVIPNFEVSLVSVTEPSVTTGGTGVVVAVTVIAPVGASVIELGITAVLLADFARAEADVIAGQDASPTSAVRVAALTATFAAQYIFPTGTMPQMLAPGGGGTIQQFLVDGLLNRMVDFV